MSKLLIPSIMATSLALTACTAIVESIPGVYTIDVQQGNIINQEIVDQLRPNMNKRQVLYIMGTPMLRDVFHKKRWEYIFSEQPGGEERLQKRISLYFKDDALIGVQGDFRPSNVTGLKPSQEVTIELPKREVERTMSEKVVNLFTFDDLKVAAEPKTIENEAAAAATDQMNSSGQADTVDSPPDSESTPDAETSEASQTQTESSEIDELDASEATESTNSALDLESSPEVETSEESPAPASSSKTDVNEEANPENSVSDSESSPEVETIGDTETQPESSETNKPNTSEEGDFFDSDYQIELPESLSTQPALSEPGVINTIEKAVPEVLNPELPAIPSETEVIDTIKEIKAIDPESKIQSLEKPPTESEIN